MKLKQQSIILLFFLLFFSVVQAQVIDSASSTVSFKIGSMGLSNVKGNISGMEGVVILDSSSPKVDVCIAPETISTSNEKRDNHLKSEDFFNIETYPTICFTGTLVNKLESNIYKVTGLLTLCDVTKEITVELTKEGNIISGTFELNRKEYNLGPSGTFLVAKNVNITLNINVK